MSNSSSKARKELPSVEFLQSLFSYDGHRLCWKDHVEFETERWNRQNAGKVAGTVNRDGYVRIAYREHRWMAHRIIFKICTGYDDVSKVVDHVNGCTWDNRILNLRLVDLKANSSNHKTRHDRALPLGVTKVRNSYMASIMRDGVKYHLGGFKSAIEASNAYVSARKLLDGADFLPIERNLVARPENVRYPYKGGESKRSRVGEFNGLVKFITLSKLYNKRADLTFSSRVLGSAGIV